MLRKYPRTRHLVGSRLQVGDEDLEAVPFDTIRGRHVVIEEKVDGANCALSFGEALELRLQSRGHYLTGGARERHFALFKQWAAVHADQFLEVLEDRYVCYGEWLYAKHTVFYDALPHYFLEFDVLDLTTGAFLDTHQRRKVLHALPIVPVPVLFEGVLTSEAELRALLARSAFKSARVNERLAETAEALELNPREVLAQTDPSDLMEGLYIKVEEDGAVRERYKFVRPDFLTRIIDSESHWLTRPIVPNELRRGIDIFSPTLEVQ